jgi:hypothetical protein
VSDANGLKKRTEGVKTLGFDEEVGNIKNSPIVIRLVNKEAYLDAGVSLEGPFA